MMRVNGFGRNGRDSPLQAGLPQRSRECVPERA
jgi:hypothetical protein